MDFLCAFVKKNMRSTLFFMTTLLLTVYPCYGENKKNEERLTYDFKKLKVKVSGVIHVKNEKERNTNGLQAEIIARSEGIRYAKQRLNQSCENNKVGTRMRNGWNFGFRSQGIQVYADNTLVILLEAPFQKVFETLPRLSEKLKSQEDKNIIFQLPQKIPENSLVCGALPLEYHAARAFLFPARAVTQVSNDSKNRVLPLKWDSSKLAFTIKDSDNVPFDEDSLESSSGKPKTLTVTIKS